MANFNHTNLQDASSYLMEQLTFFHDHSLFFLLMIVTLVVYTMYFILINKTINSFLLFNETAEIIWTLFPGVILIFIALPSLKVLYLSDEILNPLITIKGIGNQWYWSYEYPDFDNVTFESYMLKEDQLNKDDFRLLDVDNRVVVPFMTNIRMVVTSTDVIHSWTVPSMGVKMDANPGRLNQFSLESNRMGLFYGQCSEMCGTLHSFMPICVEVVKLSYFLNWLKNF
uniref:cytochrome c oxidase subunit II n=1 Tax=Plegadiphilus threskiornis TaxID=2965265 RepID=UPI0026E3F19E|nr:cytochrome c oxidase subunit II [Plegadiphilus threskiornis]WIM51531.1 cytochrome c oxidase subunit 2 [Plegadiphilus threskiornis]